MTTLIKVLDTGLISVYTVKDINDEIRELLPTKFTLVYQERPLGECMVKHTNSLLHLKPIIYSGIIFVIDDVLTRKDINVYKGAEVLSYNCRRIMCRSDILKKHRSVMIEIYPNSIDRDPKELHPRVARCHESFIFKEEIINNIPQIVKNHLNKCSNNEYLLIGFINDILHKWGITELGRACRFPAIIDDNICNTKHDISESVTLYYDMVLDGSYDKVIRDEMTISTMIEMINTPKDKQVCIKNKSIIEKIKNKINSKYYKIDDDGLTINYIHIIQAEIPFTLSEIMTLPNTM